MNTKMKNEEMKRVRGRNLAILIRADEKHLVPMEEALRKADEAGAVLASNKLLSCILLGNDPHHKFHIWLSISKGLSCWSGTMVAYEVPGKILGEIIEYVDSNTKIRYVFPVPEEHQGKENVALVTEHPNFTLFSAGNDRIVHAQEIGIVESFPAFDGWYMGDPKYDIPQGAMICEEARDRYRGEHNDFHFARYLKRIDKRIGLIVRGYQTLMWCKDVCLNFEPSEFSGAIVEDTHVVFKLNSLTYSDLKALLEESEKSIKVLDPSVRDGLLNPIKKLVEKLNKEASTDNFFSHLPEGTDR